MEQQYREEHFLLEAEGYQLPAALTLPEGQAVRWAVVLIPGSMGNDVDGNYPEMHMNPHLYADLGRQLAGRGHAVLRYAKHGSGTGSIVVDKDCIIVCVNGQSRNKGSFEPQLVKNDFQKVSYRS